jgi:biopolymer transport protein ExbD
MIKVARRVRHSGTKQPDAYLNLTSMIDMFTIILVFMLKSYAANPANITTPADINLPMSSANKDAVEALSVTVTQTAVIVEGEKVLELTEGAVPRKHLSNSEPRLIQPLYEKVMVFKKRREEIMKRSESFQGSGKLLLQADKDLAYLTIEKIMYTIGRADYNLFKLIVRKKYED